MKPEAYAAWAAVIGLDWADAKHDGCLQAAGSEHREPFSLAHTPAAIDAWVASLHKQFEGKPIALCLELNKGPLVFAVRKSPCCGLLPVTPLPLARSRDAVTPSRAQDAPTDAALPRDGLRPPRDKRQPLTPQRPTRRALEQLGDPRRRVGGANVRSTTRLTRPLKNSFPPALQWVQAKDTRLLCDFRSRWPTLKAVHLARRSTLATCVRAHPVRSAAVVTQRINAIKAAPPLTTDEGIITPHALLVQALISQRRATWRAIQDFAHAITPWAQSHPDCPLFQSLPGAGPVCAPRLLVAFGEPRDR